MAAPFVRLFALMASGIPLACASDQVESPSMNPNISNVQGDVGAPFEVSCDGPEDEVALLGGICGMSTTNLDWFATDAPAGMATAMGPDAGPLLLVYNRVDYEPSPDRNVAGELRYAAFIALNGRGNGAIETLEEWKHAEPVSSGTVVTELAKFIACTGSWEARATLRWRSTTLSLAWIAGQPC